MANTTNLNLLLPTVGGSADVWGGNLNDDLTALDAKFAPTGANRVVQTDAAGYPFGTNLVLDDVLDTYRMIWWRTATKQRWALGTVGTPNEGAGNVGADFALFRYDNAGVALDTTVPTMTAVRSSGKVQFAQTPQVNVSGTLYDVVHTGNITSSLASVVEPVGTVKMYAGRRVGSTQPSPYYMFCDGSQILVADFPDLYAVIQRFYTSPLLTDPTVFQIPNTAARIVVGKGAQPDATVWPPTYFTDTLGAAFGVGLHRLIESEMPQHNHDLHDPMHTHDFGYNSTAGPGGSGLATMNMNSVGVLAAGAIRAASTGITIAAKGGDQPHDNVQPSLVMNFIIRVK
jgi:microcystin-dependent protein